MPLFNWQPGMRVTAARMNAGILTGAESVVFDTSVSSAAFNTDYWRGSVDVTFPQGFFSSTPNIFLTGRSNVPGVLFVCTYTGVSTSGFTLMAARFSQTVTIVDWMAVQP
jgi:hypothetical protein